MLLLSYPQKTVDGQYIGGPRLEHCVHMVLSNFTLSRKAFGKLSVQVNHSLVETVTCHE